MTARIFRTEIAGDVRVGIEFDSQEEFDAFLGHRSVALVDGSTTEPADAAPDEPRLPGRPSHDKLLATAVAAFDLDTRQSVAEQARQLRAHLDQAGLSSEEVPSQVCTERYLGRAGVRQKLRQKQKRAKSHTRRK